MTIKTQWLVLIITCVLIIVLATLGTCILFLEKGEQLEGFDDEGGSYWCQQEKQIQVPVLNNIAILPCREEYYDFSNETDIKVYKITPSNHSESVSEQIYPLNNDTRSFTYIEEFGFRFDATKDLTQETLTGQKFSYSCEFLFQSEVHSHVNISLTADENFVNIETECMSPTTVFHEDSPARDFYCRVLQPYHEVQFNWFYEELSGKRTQIIVKDEVKENIAGIYLQSRIRFAPRNPNLIRIICEAHRKDSNYSQVSEGFMELEVKRAIKPKILDNDKDTILYDEKGLKLECIYRARDGANPIWLKNGRVVLTEDSYQRTLKYEDYDDIHLYNYTLSNLESPRDEINYTCVVSNAAGTDRRTYIIRKINWSKIITYSSLPILPTIIGVAVLIKILKNLIIWRRMKSWLGTQENKLPNDCVLQTKRAIQLKGGHHGEIYKVPVCEGNDDTSDKWCVMKTFKWPPFLNQKQARLVFKDLIEEHKLLNELSVNMEDPRARYIVKYLGWSAPCFSKFKVFLIFDYCEFGDLHTFLQKANPDSWGYERNKAYFYNDITYRRCEHFRRHEKERQVHPRPVLGLSHLMIFIEKIAYAFSFLEDQGIVHRDIACRNILLKYTGSIPLDLEDKPLNYNIHDFIDPQISDFGMARVVREAYESPPIELGHENEKPRNIPVPWYSIQALENIRDISLGHTKKLVYTQTDDVWSFGVLLWEIFKFGKLPYSDIPEDCVLSYLNAGRRLEQPNLIPPEIWELMRRCWYETPQDRPSFQEIYNELNAINVDYGHYEVQEEREREIVNVEEEEGEENPHIEINIRNAFEMRIQEDDHQGANIGLRILPNPANREADAEFNLNERPLPRSYNRFGIVQN